MSRVSINEEANTHGGVRHDNEDDDDIMDVQKRGAWETIVFATRRARAMPAKDLIIVVVLSLCVLIGNTVQLMALNVWMQKFPARYGNGEFAVLTVSGCFYIVFFGALLGGWILYKRPKLGFVWERRGLWLMFWIGFFDSANSVLQVYSTPHTNEVLQALFLGTLSFWTLLCTKLFTNDSRSYINRWVVGSFTLILGSVLAVLVTDIVEGPSSTTAPGTAAPGSPAPTSSPHDSAISKWMWALIFLFAVSINGFYNVFQSRYMNDYTYHVEGVTPEEIPSGKGDDTTVKLVMLFSDMIGQVVVSLAMLPFDALPWFGSSPEGFSAPGGSLDKFSGGVRYVFNDPVNFEYFCVFSVGYIIMYIGMAYLNHYSPTLNAMFVQLGSPVSALVLIIQPSWNATDAGYNTPVWVNIIAIILLTTGSLTYTLWEEMTQGNPDDDDPDRLPLDKPSSRTFGSRSSQVFF